MFTATQRQKWVTRVARFEYLFSGFTCYLSAQGCLVVPGPTPCNNYCSIIKGDSFQHPNDASTPLENLCTDVHSQMELDHGAVGVYEPEVAPPWALESTNLANERLGAKVLLVPGEYILTDFSGMVREQTRVLWA